MKASPNMAKKKKANKITMPSRLPPPDIQKSVNNPRQFQNLRQSITDTQKAGRHAMYTVSYNGNQPLPAAPASGQAHRNMSPYGQSSYSQPRPGQAGGMGHQYRMPEGPFSSTNRYQMPFPGSHLVPQLRDPGLKFAESPFYTIEHFVGEVRVLDGRSHRSVDRRDDAANF